MDSKDWSEMSTIIERDSDGVVMEGWLYLIRSNKIGFQYSKKAYFVLQHHLLHIFKSQTKFSIIKDPIRSLGINSSFQVTDYGRESIQRRAFYVFTLQNTINLEDHVKLGATSPEEAARWIKTIRESTITADLIQGPLVACSKREWQYTRLNCSSRVHNTGSLDWSCCSSSYTDPTTADTVSPSTWTIFSCHNGLRLFKETKDRECLEKISHSLDNYPAIMAMGVINGNSEAIFQTVMSLGSSRSQWDFSFKRGSVIEHIDGHTDIVHKVLYRDWLPWGMKRRDLLLHRFWRRDEDGTYVILYHSVLHKKCPPQKGYVRASLKSGGYVISTVNEGDQSVVRHMLAIDWKYWKTYRKASSAQSLTIRMLGRLAALRELFSTKPGLDSSSKPTLRDLMSNDRLHQSEKIEENGKLEDDMVASSKYHSCRVQLDDNADEFILASEPLDYDEVQKRDFMDLECLVREDGSSCCYGATLPKDPTCNLLSSWSAADTSIFQIRGKTYLQDYKKIMANSTLMQMVGVDLVKSNKREDDLGGRPGSIVQKFAAEGGPEFFFIINLQFPGSTTYSLAFYMMMSAPVEDVPLLASFINGDDAYRNSRFKLLASVSKGPWIIKQTIGKKASRLGQRLPVNYIHGQNYLELDVDVGASALARRTSSMVFTYFSHLVVEVAFVIEANTEEELPERLLGAFQLNHLDTAKSVSVTQK